MTGLQKPPKSREPTRIVVRLLVLVLLLLAVAVLIWSATTDTLVDATEDVSIESLNLETRAEYLGTSINVVEEEGGAVPLILLNGYDVSGGVVWDGLVSSLDEQFRPLRVDLPGFGLSDRIPEEGSEHTVASMAQVVASVIEDRVGGPTLVVGAGLGGEVAAELGVTRPDLVSGLVMIDVDFWESRSWLRFAESLPYIGRPVTYTFEGGGRFGVDQWAPWCDEGGWCPTRGQADARALAASIQSTTDSLRSFIKTKPASLVPSDLSTISAPTIYVWSSAGVVPRDSVEMVANEMTATFRVEEVDAHQAHLESPAAVAAILVELTG